MIRLRLLLLALLAAPIPAAMPAGPASASERVILYVDADSDLVRAAIARFEAALDRRGIRARHRVAVRHVPVDVFDRKQAAARIATALRAGAALVIATSSESATIAKSVAGEVPIVFGSHQDPVRLGLVRSLAEPGGNTTGFTFFAPIDLKRLELLREIAPRARRLGIVIDHWWMQETDGERLLRDAKARLGFEGRVFLMEKPEDLRQLDAAAAREIQAWYVPVSTLPLEDPVATVRAIAALHRPAVFANRALMDAGAPIAYEPKVSLDEALDLLAKLAGLILDGVPAGSIPIERPKSFELSINLAAARQLGIALPAPLLKRADRVIDRAPQ